MNPIAAGIERPAAGLIDTPLVVDSSVLVALVAGPEIHREWADRTLNGATLVCPELALAEACNILRRLEQAGKMSSGESSAALSELKQILLHMRPFEPYVERVWELRHNLTCYDAWYVAIAESFQCPLVTLDVRLSRANGPKCLIIAPSAPVRYTIHQQVPS